MPQEKQPTHANDLRWTKVFGAAIASATLVASIAWGAIEMRGNQVWAPKSETATAIVRVAEKIETIHQQVIINDVLDQEHHNDTDLHMSEAAKRASFYTRPEGTRLESAIEQMQADNLAFWKEQRTVNREVLNRLPR